uniref:long-chain-alcohol O-fatty-acyltransferase-like n=1 Tax=Erigeron canadensis TaxID=72917 RepID=UPI001CB937F5|nr:long-chain-alcohol O-fatty-acyltransferase-like [Erigeron canadensis]
MEDAQELKTFLKVWSFAILCVCYCYLIPSRIANGVPRFLSILPIIVTFFILPLPLSSVHLAGPTIFYLVWLANFKLLLFAFNRGPLASMPKLPFLIFISIALLPINRKHANKTRASTPAIATSHRPGLLAFKALIIAIIIGSYEYKDHLHPNVILGFYCCHFCLVVELILAITAFFVWFLLGFGFEMEPQFNEPYLATSLQDFWGRRWNLMVTNILRPTVYDPIRVILDPLFGKLWSQLSAIFATFIVSGLLHELIYFYLTRVPATWEVTWFFVLHGACTTAEVLAKKKVNGRFRLHRVVTGPPTVAFVAVTSVWLFLPQLSRNGVDVKAINEYYTMVNFLRSKPEGVRM